MGLFQAIRRLGSGGYAVIAATDQIACDATAMTVTPTGGTSGKLADKLAAVNVADTFWFGDGSDGNVTISAGTTTLTRDMYYNNLTLSGTGQLVGNGFRIFVLGTLDLTAAAAGAIVARVSAPGNSGPSPASAVAAAAQSLAAGSVDGGSTGTAGAAGTSATTGLASTGAAASYFGGAAGISGSGGQGNTGSNLPGAVGVSTGTALPMRRATLDFLYGLVLPTGGQPSSGGSGAPGGGSSAYGGGGGGGAPGGGVLAVYARTLARGTSSVAATLQARGNAGGNGSSGTSGQTIGGGGGGAGGSGGGLIMLVYRFLTGSAVTNFLDAVGGSGGAGGAKASAATASTNGTGGNGGSGGLILVANLGANTLSATTGASGTAASGQTGGAGGACQASL